MILAFRLADIIQVPFGWLLDILYRFTTSYGWALILFSIIVKTILMPTTIKSKRSMMKMSRLTPRIQEIQKKYEGDQQKQNQAIQELYKTEGVSMGGGCLWSLVPLLILIPLYRVIREPITYILHQDASVSKALTDAVWKVNPTVFDGVQSAYHQLVAAANMTPEIAGSVEGVTDIDIARVGQGLNFHFLGVDLAMVPEYNVFNKEIWVWDWAHIGAFLLPVLATLAQLATMIISQKINDSLVTNEKGVQDKEAAKNAQSKKSGKAMLYLMPVMTLFIGFGMPAALSLYWLIQSIVGAVFDNILTVKFRKEYDEEDARRLQKAMEEEAAEQERERIRAERRAANPDGITENTSKKKLQQKQQREQEAAKAAAQKEYNAKKGIIEEEKPKPEAMSGIPERPYCKGRNYDPNRYASEATEEE